MRRAQAYVGAFMAKPKEDREGMSAAESAGAESFESSNSDFPSASSASTSSAVPSADAESPSDPSSGAAASSPEAGAVASPSGQSTESDLGGLTSEDQLYEVGTFAQVHNIVAIDPKRAQLLLLGHRRLKRIKQVLHHRYILHVDCQLHTAFACKLESRQYCFQQCVL